MMSIAKKFFGILILVLLSNPSLGVEERKENGLSLPRDLMMQIFSWTSSGELAKCLVVCRKWKEMADTDGLWKIMADDLEKTHNLGNHNCTPKQYVHACQAYALGLDALQMETWDEEKLSNAVSDEGFNRLHELLLTNLQRTAFLKMDLLIVDRKSRLAALLANYYIMDRSLIFGKIWCPSWDETFNSVNDQVGSVFKNLALEIISIAEKNMKIPNKSTDIRLETLFKLANASEEKYFGDCFPKIFSGFTGILDEDYSPMMIDEVLAIFARAFGDELNPAQAKNPHIMLFKRIYEWSGRKISPQEEMKE